MFFPLFLHTPVKRWLPHCRMRSYPWREHLWSEV